MYVSQSDKGGLVYGGNLDYYNSYAQRGNLPVVHEVATRASRRASRTSERCGCVRSWGGLVDMTMDGSPIITTGPLPGMYLNCRLELRGLQGDAGVGLVLRLDTSPATSRTCSTPPFTLERFHEGRPIDEWGAGPTPRLHYDADPLPRLRSARPERVHLWRRRDDRPPGASPMPTPARWADYVYDRRNPRGPHQEYWHHVHGCRTWMIVERNTETHDVSGARLIGPWAGREDG